jgi:hypothetical protein
MNPRKAKTGYSGYVGSAIVAVGMENVLSDYRRFKSHRYLSTDSTGSKPIEVFPLY